MVSTPPDISRITGNAPDHVKSFLADPTTLEDVSGLSRTVRGFGYDIIARMEVTEVSVSKKMDEPLKEEGRVVVKMKIEQDMVHGGLHMHGGCSAFIIDTCTTLAMAALTLGTVGKKLSNVSLALNILYHAPAALGEELRIVSTTLTVGGRAFSARTEMWSDTHNRLVASGVHVKLSPSTGRTPKL
ncbi:hypothetical protein E1B28_004830 [Marasmius oreades]|uniref:Thioesterase domain-containing protein n=1 Tax=Marasmius oreades TaxID=181124 RepID=A0A9P7UZH9_9AGAR|nr:uncharacterized protein E1B28_004830 [Marasmius oreades]KAG7097488.1 hypothetical protein E1B28_004830 [Marasmius oreades]